MESLRVSVHVWVCLIWLVHVEIELHYDMGLELDEAPPAWELYL